MNNLIKLKQVCDMTEEQIERLKDDLRKYTLCYDWWGQSGYNYVKKTQEKSIYSKLKEN